MAEPAGPDDAPSPPPAVAPSFCGACGRTLDPTGICPVCAAAPAPGRSSRPAGEIRGLRRPLALYFALLAVILGVLLCPSTSATLQLGTDILFAAIVTLFAAASWREIGTLLRAPHPTYLALAPLIGAGTFLLASGGVWLLGLIGVEAACYTEEFVLEGYGIPVILTSLAGVPALFEEIAFRGLILERMRALLGDASAILVTALMFSILHLSIPSLPHLFVIGIAFAWLRLASGSLWPGILAHFTHNAAVAAVELSVS